MFKPTGLLTLLFSLPAWATGALTDVEAHWIEAAAPVLDYAAAHQVPIDIIVQPEDSPGEAPVSMAIDNGRCKLVMSMRGNTLADHMFDGVPASLESDMIEAMAAHELAHCWRYQRGVWHSLPAGFSDAAATAVEKSPQGAELRRQMAETRREEAFADLVGLAWIARTHPGEYDQVYRWFELVRSDRPAGNTWHDTHAWLQLVPTASAFQPDVSIFEQAQPLWKIGLAESGETLRH